MYRIILIKKLKNYNYKSNTFIHNMFYCHQETTEHFVIEDAIFGRMDDIGDMFKKEVHEEFITNCIRNTPGNFFPEYSYVYVLVAHGCSNKDVPEGEKKWSDILNNDQYEFLSKHSAYIVAWMLMTPEHPIDIHLIEYIDSRVSGYNLTDCIIKKFENEIAYMNDSITSDDKVHTKIKPKCVLPKEITHGSVLYWKKFLERRYDVRSKNDLDSLINTLRIEKQLWNILIKKIE